jgi:hypothetical protein
LVAKPGAGLWDRSSLIWQLITRGAEKMNRSRDREASAQASLPGLLLLVAGGNVTASRDAPSRVSPRESAGV